MHANHATLVRVNNPFAPYRDREVRDLACAGPIGALAPRTRSPFIIQRNGVSVLRRDWDQPVERGDIITVIVLPQGGGGGGSNPLRIILMLAVMVFATWAAPQLLGTTFGAYAATAMGSTGLFLSVATGVIGMAGSMLINALIPPPKLPSSQQSSGQTPSPTYSLQAQGNTARIDSAIPVQYGRMMAYPDLAAMPYAEYAGNEQYLYQLFCLGQGEYEIEAIRVEDTAISSFEEIEYQIVPPEGAVTLFPANVVTSVEVAGQDAPGILAGATYSQTGTTVTVSKTAHGFVIGRHVYLLVSSGTLLSAGYVVATVAADTFTVTAASATTSGDCTIQTIIGPFVASAATTTANTIAVDVILPRALYYANNSGGLDQVSISFAADLRQIDDTGAPIGSWYTAGSETITLATNTPQRFSYRYGVATGRYEARLRRTDEKETDSKYGHDLAWGGLRAYLPNTTDYGLVTLIAMRMRASNNLSQQASRKINVICTRKLRTWNAIDGWSVPVATRSIAWAFADAAQNQTYGGKMADAHLDLAGLYALDATWTSRGDNFDARFDNTLTLWEGLTKIANAGRAKPFMQGGVLYVARDQSATLPVALFSMRNIVKGSFSVEYIMPTDDTADVVEASYFDDVAWSPRRVSGKLVDSLATRPAKIDLFGVTNRAHVHREAVYQAASNRYRRRLIRFTSEMESFIPAFLDPIAIQHDMPQWGQHGEVTAVETVTNLLTYSEQFDNAAWTAITTKVLTANTDAAPDGTLSADTITDNSAVAWLGAGQTVTVANDSATYAASVYVKKTSGGTAATFGMNINLTGGTPVSSNPRLNTDTGATAGSNTSVHSVGNYWRLTSLITNNASGNTSLRVSIYPATAGYGSMSDSSAAQGSAVIWGAQLEAAPTAGPYVKTAPTDRAAQVLNLTEPLTWATSGTHYIGLRKKDGSVDGPIEVTWAGKSSVACVTAPTVAPYTGSDYERTHITFGWGETWRQLARVISVTPRGLYQAEILAINEDPSVHTADVGVTAPAVSSSQLPNMFTLPTVQGLVVASSTGDINTMLLSWQSAAGADHYLIEQSSGDGSWTRVGETSTAAYAVRVLYGSSTLVRVAAVGVTRGPWVTVSYASGADYMWVAGDDTDEMWSVGDDADVMW
jgi:hypothetical protein